MGTDSQFVGNDGYEPSEESSYVRATAVPVAGQLAEVDFPLAPPAAPSPGLGTAVRIVHRGLRGWYWLAIILGLLLGGPAAFLGWKTYKPMYHSEAMIRIAYSLPEVYQETDQNRPMASFDAFMQSQRSLVLSTRVMETSFQELANSWPLSAEEYQKTFAANVKVDIKPHSEFIIISVNDPNRDRAAAIATAVQKSYMDLFDEQQSPAEKARLSVLMGDENSKKNEIDAEKSALAKLSAEYGTTNLDEFYQAAVARVTRLEADLADVRAAKAMAPATEPSEVAAVPKPPTTAPVHVPLTEYQVAAVDGTMARFVGERMDLERQLERFAAQGLGDAHKTVVITRRELDDAKARIAEYLDTYNKTHPDGLTAADRGNAGMASRPVATLAANESNLEKLKDGAIKEMKEIGQKRLNLADKESHLQALQAEYEKLQKRIEMFEAEGKLAKQLSTHGTRISRVSSGSVPLSPERDLRLPVAAASGMAGLLLPATLMILFSLMRRRFHYSDDATVGMPLGQAPLIGILPNLKENELQGDNSAAAANGVHQMRVSLQARNNRRANAYLVTSAIAGEGKTSVAMSLGLSFAASRFKTLVIDADLIGRHLTAALEVPDLEGLYEALDDGNLRARIRKFDQNLFVLPAGMGDHSDACAIAPAAMGALLAEARRYFHTIIVDSGPILGSLEAAVIAQEVDGVLFAIGRGQQRQVVEKAMRRLQTLDAPVAGCIFNRAKDADFHSSPYGSSSSHYTMSDKPLMSHPHAERLSRFGPLVQAVANRMPQAVN